MPQRFATALAILLPALVVIMHAGLWPQGMWHDEFLGFTAYKLSGVDATLQRLWAWTPRPFSEGLLLAYWLAVRFSQRPLLLPVLATAWAFLATGLLAAAQPWNGPGRTARWALVVTLPALFLVSAQIGEMFYWPFGALSYLPALGAATYVAITVAGAGLRNQRDWVVTSICLSIGAASVEIGAFFALCAAPGLLLSSGTSIGGGRFLRIASCLVPMFLGLVVVLMLVHGRAATSGVWGSQAVFHHVKPSLWLAVGQILHEFLRPDGGSIVAATGVKALVFLGARQCLASGWAESPPSGPILAIVAGLAGAAFLSIFGAYYVFGAICCERHATYRQALFLLMIVASAGLWRPTRVHNWGPVILALALLIYLPPRIPELRTEYGLVGDRAEAWRILFRSGLQPGPAPLEYLIAPSGPLLQYEIFPPGSYRTGPALGWSTAAGPMLFFGKNAMIARRLEP